MKFTDLNLHPLLLKALEQCGYTTPTPIQAQAIPLVLTGQDLIASAQTGTGKTAAFLLPAIHNMLSNPSQHKKPRILVLSPTRELAQQIEKAARDYSRCVRMSSVSLVGGMPYPPQIRSLGKPLDLVIATPGRLMDHLERGRIDLSAIETLVLDEADRMLDMGFIDDVKHIASLCNKNRQTLLFSATIDKEMERFASTLVKDPARVKVEAEKTNQRKIQQSVYLADGMQHKTAILSHILKQEPIFKGIIFTATKSSADDLAKALVEQGHKVAAMHGDKRQAQRIRTLEQLRNGKLQLIVATDVAARGIDINSITHVINFDMPKFAEDYVHRIGRTGRAGQSGIAITFATLNEKHHLQKIERYIGQSIVQTVVEGLEPKAKFSANSEKPKAKRRFANNEGYSAKRNSSPRFSSAKPGHGRTENNRGDSGRSGYGRSENSRGDSGRSSYGRTENNRADSGRSSYGRTENNRSDVGRSGYGRTENNRTDSNRSEFGAREKNRTHSGRGRVQQPASAGFTERNSEGRNKPAKFSQREPLTAKKADGLQARHFDKTRPVKAKTAKPKLSLKPKKVANY